MEYATPFSINGSCVFIQLHMLLKMCFLAHNLKKKKKVKGKRLTFWIFSQSTKEDYYSAVVKGSINFYIKANQACSKRFEHQITLMCQVSYTDI